MSWNATLSPPLCCIATPVALSGSQMTTLRRTQERPHTGTSQGIPASNPPWLNPRTVSDSSSEVVTRSRASQRCMTDAVERLPGEEGIRRSVAALRALGDSLGFRNVAGGHGWKGLSKPSSNVESLCRPRTSLQEAGSEKASNASLARMSRSALPIFSLSPSTCPNYRLVSQQG